MFTIIRDVYMLTFAEHTPVPPFSVYSALTSTGDTRSGADLLL